MNQTSLVGRPLAALTAAVVKFAERRGVWSGPLTSSSPELARLWGASQVSAGVDVNQTTALSVAAFFSVVTLISGDIAGLPLKLYKRLKKGGKEPFENHPLYSLLHDAPNPEQTSFQFLSAMVMCVLCYGNAFAEIVRDAMGRPRQLWHLDPARVSVLRENGHLQDRVMQPAGGSVLLDARDVIHLVGPSLDGCVGLNMVSIAQDAIGLAIASERFGGKFFANGAMIGGILSPGANVTELSLKNFRESVNAQHQGVDRSHKLLVTPSETKFTPTGISPRDSQMGELRSAQVDEIARFYRVPPALVGSLDRATWGNYSEQKQQYFVQCLAPWLKNLEQEFSLKLIGPHERSELAIEFTTEGFLRSDIEKRAQFYKLMLECGVYSINQVLDLESMAPVPGGDVHRVPMNYQNLPAPEPVPDVTPARMVITGSAHRDLLLYEISRALWKICDRAAKQTQPSKLRVWAEMEMKDGRLFSSQFIDAIRPAMRAWSSTVDRASEVDGICESLARYYIDSIFPTLIVIANHYAGDEFLQALERQLALWRDQERLHGVIDHLITHGTPPPVKAPTKPGTPARGMTLDMGTKLHKTRIAASEAPAYKTPIDKMREDLERLVRTGSR